MFVIVCYTDIQQEHDVTAVAPSLNAMTGMLQWTVDLTDCYKVLRVVAYVDIAEQVQHTLHTLGYTCRVIPY